VPAGPVDEARRRTIVRALQTDGASLVLGLVLAALVASRIPRAGRHEPEGADVDGSDRTAVRHELRNRLGAISVATDVLESAEPSSPEAAEARAIVARQSRDMAHLLEDLLRPDGVAPMREDEDAGIGAGVDEIPPARRRQVLVVDDDEGARTALRARLESDGHTVATASDGSEGLSRLLQLRPEVSIVDIGMPGRTGYELARSARAAGYAGRMIALAPQRGTQESREALVAGFDACLAAPVDETELRDSLQGDG
jgi:CheY-like chemotaxis protein